MITRALLRFSAGLEAATGLSLIALPEIVAHVLLGSGLSASGVAVARVGGFGLLSLGLACWPSGEDVTTAATWALLVYNLLAAIYLGYLRIGGGFGGILLLPASALHAVLTLLFVGPAYKRLRT